MRPITEGPPCDHPEIDHESVGCGCVVCNNCGVLLEDCLDYENCLVSDDIELEEWKGEEK